jgi:hypothetical protein
LDEVVDEGVGAVTVLGVEVEDDLVGTGRVGVEEVGEGVGSSVERVG